MFYIPISKPIEKEEIDYEIPPYVIGAFLANGCCVNHARLTLSTGNEDVPQTICSFIKNLKYKEGYNNYKWQFYFEENDNRNFLMTKKIFNMFKNEICQYSHNKRIPDIYKNGSIKQRLELLQGLFDGDGSITQKGGTVTYSSVSKQLIDDIREVLWSLGYCSKLYKLNRPKIYKHDSYYISVNIPNYEKEKLFLIKRKKDIALKFKNIKQKKDFDRTSIRSIEKMNYKEDMTCFYVDNEEHLFLMNDYIVTHNTRVLTERVRRLLLDGVEPSNMVIISFTRMAAEELKERLVDVPGIGDCFVGTIHAFANKIFQNSEENYKLYSDEIENQFMTVLINLYGKHITMDKFFIYKDIMKKIDLGLKTEIDLNAALTQNEIYEIEVFLGRIKNESYPQNIHTLCKKHNVITFDELLKKTTEYFKQINGKVEYLFVDEFQDIGKLERDFFKALNADNYFYVGDEKQCQPKGTKITMGDLSIKNIEDLKIGDVVLSYNIKEGHYCFDNKKGKGKKIIDISKHYEDELIEIETENGLKSSYTKNHKCLARIHYEGNENKSVVYIMQNKKGQFRVGSTKLFTFDNRNFGLRGRMNTEKAINGWILGIYENPYEAWLMEQTCAYKFGIPQLTWVYKNLSKGKPEDREKNVDKLYSLLDNLEDKVKKCLEYFGRDINYPIFTKNKNKHFSKIHITEINACNLFPEVMDIASPYRKEDGRFKHQYFQIKNVNVSKGKREVYGLKIDKTETYVADGILTHNSIYGFKGGNVTYFTNLMKSPKWKTYYLNNNYRCGSKIIDIANKVIAQADDIINTKTICMSNKEGNYKIDSKYKIDQYLNYIKEKGDYIDWFILARTNKDIAKLEILLSALNIPYVSFKKGEMTLEEMRKFMAENKVKLLTIHTSKGLESKNVLLYGNFPIKQKPYLRNNDEIKVQYVGMTRSMDNLIILN